MSIIYKTLLSLSFLFIYSCGGGGGGGGGGGPSSAPAPAPPPTYIISEGNSYSTSVPSLLYIDENMNGLRDSYEKTTTPSSDGSFSFSTTNSGEVACLKKHAILSESPLSFSHNPSEGSNVKINAFTSLFSDGQVTFGKNVVDPSRLASDENCSNYERYKLQIQTRYLRDLTVQMEQYDNQTYEQISSNPTSPAEGSVITSSRQRDLEKFYASIGAIEVAVNTDLQTLIAANAPGINLSLKTRAELDFSNMRIFLNGSGYPNPSTDPSPVANNVDSIAAKAGLEIYASTANYSGAYTNSFEVAITDMKISNAGKILQNNLSCYINFSSLCLVEPTFKNAIAYGEPSIRDTLHKTTARGIESFSSEEIITDSSTLACRDYNYIALTDTSLSNETRTYEHEEFLGEGTYNVEDLGCYVTQSNRGSWLAVYNRYADGAYESVRMYYDRNRTEPGITSNFPDSINYYNYDEVDTPPDQIPQSYISAFLALGSGGWDTVNKVLADDPRANSNSLWANGMLMVYTFQNKDGRVGRVYASFSFSQTSIACSPIDGEFFDEWVSHTDMIAGNFTTLDICKTQLTRTYEPISEVTQFRNSSPYRGAIDD